MRKKNSWIGLTVLALLVILGAAFLALRGRGNSSGDAVERALSALGEPKEEAAGKLKIPENSLVEKIPLFFQSEKKQNMGSMVYYPMLEVGEGQEVVTGVGFLFESDSAKEVLKLSQKILTEVTAELKLEASVPAGSQLVYEEGSSEDGNKGISETTAEELEKAQACALTEVWNRGDEMYFRAVLTKMAGKSGGVEYLLMLSYIGQELPAFAG